MSPTSASPLLLPIPRCEDAAIVVAVPGAGPGNWVGAPSVVLAGGFYHAAYRLRAPLGHGRGLDTVIGRSTDGVGFTEVARVTKDRFGAESLERPALVRTPAGRWRLYVSCATPGSKHWWVDVLEADTPEELADAPRLTVLPGDDLKDPAIVVEGGRWHLWASVHPLDVPEHEDRMTTEYYTSVDGLAWRHEVTALAPREGRWDARGRGGCGSARSSGSTAAGPPRTTAAPRRRRTGRNGPAYAIDTPRRLHRSGARARRGITPCRARAALPQRGSSGGRRVPALLRGHPRGRGARAAHRGAAAAGPFRRPASRGPV